MNYKYHKISSKFWTDEKVINWDNDTRILAIYLLTCPHRTTEGIFRLPKQYIMADLQWSPEQLDKPFTQLLKDGFIKYDEKVNVILLTKALKYNPPQNPNQETSAINNLKELPETPLLARFITLAERFTEGFAKRLHKEFGKPQTQTQTHTLTQYNNNYRPDSESSPDPSQGKSKPADQEESPDNLPAKPEDNGPKFNEESIPYKAACYLRAKILENNKRAQVPNKDPASMEDWATEMDRLNRLGPVGAKESENKGYTWEEIGKIIDWCQQDPFWKSNILSAGKLREKIVTLENQMKNRSSPRNKQARKDEMLRELYQEAMEEDRQGNTEVNVL